MAIECSQEMTGYFAELDKKVDKCYKLAERARSKGFDPETHVEIPRAEDLAERVERLLEQLEAGRQ